MVEKLIKKNDSEKKRVGLGKIHDAVRQEKHIEKLKKKKNEKAKRVSYKSQFVFLSYSKNVIFETFAKNGVFGV